ncbi:MAG: hypothetical protein AMJ89_04280, partial [candidate division Zixibacteria bacterium SM23_73]
MFLDQNVFSNYIEEKLPSHCEAFIRIFESEETMPQKYKTLIGGKWIEGKEFLEVTNKYTGEVIGSVPVAD